MARRETPGAIKDFAGGAIPHGYLGLDGTEVPIASYPALDAWIGRTFALDSDGQPLLGSRTNGAGAAGSTHVKLPDSRGRSHIGSGTGAGLSVRALGQRMGAETHTLTAAESGLPSHQHQGHTTPHGHTINDPGHAHTVDDEQNSGHKTVQSEQGDGSGNVGINPSTTGITINGVGDIGDMTDSVAAANAGQAHNIMSPSLVVTKIVKY